MSCSLNSLKPLYRGIYRGHTTGLIEGDTRSLAYSSYVSRQTCAVAVPLKQNHGLTQFLIPPKQLVLHFFVYGGRVVAIMNKELGVGLNSTGRSTRSTTRRKPQ